MNTELFLTEEAWNAFRSYGRPVTAAESTAFKGVNPLTPETICWFCGLRGCKENPLEAAHRIPSRAVIEFALKPDVTNRDDNFVWAHRRDCNDSVELKRLQIMRRLMSFGVKELPSYLPRSIRDAWEKESEGIFEPSVARPEPEKKRFVAPTTFPKVSPSSAVRRENYKAPSGTPSLPHPSEMRAEAAPTPQRFTNVPPPSAVRRKKSKGKSSKSQGEEVDTE